MRPVCMIAECETLARYTTTYNAFCEAHAPATLAEMVKAYHERPYHV